MGNFYGDLLSGITGSGQAKQGQTGFKSALASNKRLESEFGNLKALIAALGQQQLGALDQSYKGAFDSLNRGAAVGRQSVMDTARTQGGAATQSLMGSGFFNSSLAPRAAGAIAGQEGSNLANVEAALAHAKGNLDIQRGTQRAGFLAQQGNAQMQLYKFLEDILNNRGQLQIGKGLLPKGGWGEFLGGLAPSVAQGAAMG